MSYPTDAIATQSTGHGVTAADWDELVDALNAIRAGTVAVRAVIQTVTATGTQNNLSVTAARYLVLFFNNATDATATGFQPTSTPQDGDIIDLFAIGAGNVFVTHQGSGSTAAYRCNNNVTSGPTPLAGGYGRGRWIYDADTRNAGANPRWKCHYNDQGKAITPTFSAGDFVGAVSWTVASGDVDTFSYYIVNSLMVFSFDLETTTVGGPTSGPCTIAMPGGYVVKTRVRGAGLCGNPGFTPMSISGNAAGTTLSLGINANWDTTADGVSMVGQIQIPLS